jgi:hypothetical protein
MYAHGRAVMLAVGLGALVGVVLLGYFYGSPSQECLSGLPLARLARRGWQLTVVFWALCVLAVGGVVTVLVMVAALFWDLDFRSYHPLDVLTHPLFWCGAALLVGGGIGWNWIARQGWTCAGGAW